MAVLFILYIPFEEPDSPFIRQNSTAHPLSLDLKGKEEDRETSEKDPLLGDTDEKAGGENADQESISKPDEGGGQAQADKEAKLDPEDKSDYDTTPAAAADDVADGSVQNTTSPNISTDESQDVNDAKPASKKCVSFDHQLSTDPTLLTSERISFTTAIQGVLASLGIENDTWIMTDDKNYHQISFVVETQKVDKVMNRLTKFGIGTITDTSISMFPANYNRTGFGKDEEQDPNKQTACGEEDFVSTIKSRLTVAQVETGLFANTALTFDYVVMVTLASFIAGMGLAENSSVVLVASMLVSPLMGPILGGVFGLVVKNRQLWQLGLKNELIGLGICLAVGFLFGLAPAAANVNGAEWGSSDSWPTTEMRSRGMLRGLWVGLLIALPSGAGVAFSILGGNTGSLVGVAISASLLPPAVNAGMLWAYALSTGIHHPEFVPLPSTAPDVALTYTENSSVPTSGINVSDSPPLVRYPPNCGSLVDNSYEFIYRCNMQEEAAILGAVSLFLTLLNILCIIVMAYTVLKIKEVAPNTASSDAANTFFKKDIKIARNAYTTMKKSNDTDNLAEVAKDIALKLKEKHRGNLNKVSARLRHSWHNICEEVGKDDIRKQCADWMPYNNQPKFAQMFEQYGDKYIGGGVASDSDSDSDVYITVRNKETIDTYHQPKDGGHKLLRRRQPSGASETTSPPSTPVTFHTPLPSQNDEFEFDESKIRHRKKRPRYSRTESCPGQVLVPRAETKKEGRFNITKIEEENLDETRTPSPTEQGQIPNVSSKQSLLRQGAVDGNYIV